MDIHTVGIISPGEMGSSIGRTLDRNGLRIVTTLDGRSERTRANAREAGFDVLDLEELVAQADIVLSVVVSEAASEVARRVAGAARSTGEAVLFADMNPLAPTRVRSLADEVGESLDVVDGGIIGPASDLSRTTLYFAGPRAAAAAGLDAFGVNAAHLGDRVGQASGLKLCYAGMTKGLSALGMDLLLGATALEIEPEVEQLYADRLPGVMPFLDGRLPGNPKRAERRAQELDELATMLEGEGLEDRLAVAGADRLHWLGSLGLDTDDAEDAVETARRVFDTVD